MRIAIESNDGVTIKSPFLRTKGYVVYEIIDARIHNLEYRETKTDEAVKTDTEIFSPLNDCSAVISRGMDRKNLDRLKKEGKEVFITFKNSAKDAANLYAREILINNNFIC